MSKILVAEDEPALLECYCELIAGLGHECIVAQDGGQAISLARMHSPDLVVTDYMMPVASGADVIRALRAEPSLAHVAVILISAGRPPEQDCRAAWAYLSKPLDPTRFEEAVRGGLRASEAALVDQHSVNRMAGQASITQLREQMLSWVAHEIKSPLSAAMMASELALRGLEAYEDRAAIEKRVQTVLRQLNRMDELVNSILDAAQLEEGRLLLQTTQVDVDDLVARAVSFWSDLYPDVHFIVSGHNGAVVHGDPERLRQILDNLVSNAVKYGKPNRAINIDIKVAPSGISIAVSDHGPGIPPAELPRIFDRFHRVSGQAGRGHGLGLYISAALARLHGGTIAVESELGRGTTFALELPRP